MRIRFEGDRDERFRSALEQQTADELDHLGVGWQYREAVILGDETKLRYRPSFTISKAPGYLQLPPWVDCVEQGLLYDLRDLLNVTQTAGEYFHEDVIVEGADAVILQDHSMEPLAKPKQLAEHVGGEILVLGCVRGNNRLSVLMRERSIVFSRYHPFVNHPGYIKRQQKQAARENYRLEQERLQNEKRNEIAQIIDASTVGIVPKFVSKCYGCPDRSQTGLVWGRDTPSGTRWVRVCPECRVRAEGM